MLKYRIAHPKSYMGKISTAAVGTDLEGRVRVRGELRVHQPHLRGLVTLLGFVGGWRWHNVFVSERCFPKAML